MRLVHWWLQMDFCVPMRVVGKIGGRIVRWVGSIFCEFTKCRFIFVVGKTRWSLADDMDDASLDLYSHWFRGYLLDIRSNGHQYKWRIFSKTHFQWMFFGGETFMSTLLLFLNLMCDWTQNHNHRWYHHMWSLPKIILQKIII
jgi:hypothetical protein